MFRKKHLLVAVVMTGAISMAGAAYAFWPGNGPAGYGPGNVWPHGGPGILWILVLAIVVFWLVRTASMRRRAPTRDTALDELRRQYATGKIDHEEFLRRRTNLTSE